MRKLKALIVLLSVMLGVRAKAFFEESSNWRSEQPKGPTVVISLNDSDESTPNASLQVRNVLTDTHLSDATREGSFADYVFSGVVINPDNSVEAYFKPNVRPVSANSEESLHRNHGRSIATFNHTYYGASVSKKFTNLEAYNLAVKNTDFRLSSVILEMVRERLPSAQVIRLNTGVHPLFSRVELDMSASRLQSDPSEMERLIPIADLDSETMSAQTKEALLQRPDLPGRIGQNKLDRATAFFRWAVFEHRKNTTTQKFVDRYRAAFNQGMTPVFDANRPANPNDISLSTLAKLSLQRDGRDRMDAKIISIRRASLKERSHVIPPVGVELFLVRYKGPAVSTNRDPEASADYWVFMSHTSEAVCNEDGEIQRVPKLNFWGIQLATISDMEPSVFSCRALFK